MKNIRGGGEKGERNEREAVSSMSIYLNGGVENQRTIKKKAQDRSKKSRMKTGPGAEGSRRGAVKKEKGNKATGKRWSVWPLSPSESKKIQVVTGIGDGEL